MLSEGVQLDRGYYLLSSTLMEDMVVACRQGNVVCATHGARTETERSACENNILKIAIIVIDLSNAASNNFFLSGPICAFIV